MGYRGLERSDVVRNLATKSIRFARVARRVKMNRGGICRCVEVYRNESFSP